VGLLVFIADGRDMVVRCAWPWAPRSLDDDGILVQGWLVEGAGVAHGHLMIGQWGTLALAGGVANTLARVQHEGIR